MTFLFFTALFESSLFYIRCVPFSRWLMKTYYIILFDYPNLLLINSFCIIWLSLFLLITSIWYHLFLIIYFSSTHFVLFDHHYYLVYFLFFFPHIFHFRWLMLMQYIIQVLLFITLQLNLFYFISHIYFLINTFFFYTSNGSLMLTSFSS